jgi:hypothetical protein
MCSAGILTAFDQEGKIFSICFSTGAFLLGFPNFIVTANLFHASFPGYWISWKSAYDGKLAEDRAGAHISSSNKMTLYLHTYEFCDWYQLWNVYDEMKFKNQILIN